MAIVGAFATVTVEGFGSKSGTVDQYDRDQFPATPYHVTFQDGMSGWYNAAQVSFDELKEKAIEDPFVKAAEQMFSQARPTDPQYYPVHKETHN